MSKVLSFSDLIIYINIRNCNSFVEQQASYEDCVSNLSISRSHQIQVINTDV